MNLAAGKREDGKEAATACTRQVESPGSRRGVCGWEDREVGCFTPPPLEDERQACPGGRATGCDRGALRSMTIMAQWNSLQMERETSRRG